MHKIIKFININIRNGVVYILKSTGVIRRIDELGRIVIPKEIRRNLGIRDGENVEIYTDSDNIILKKYYRMTTNTDLASKLCSLIYNLFNYKIIITDREKVLATGGLNIDSASISEDLINLIEAREISTRRDYKLKIGTTELIGNFVFVPIISLNDSIGLIILYNDHELTTEDVTGKLVASIFAEKLDI